MTSVIFCNEKAGTFESCNQHLGLISSELEEVTGVKSKIVNTEDFTDEDLNGATRAIIMGGDGTVGRLLGRLANHTPRIPVAIIPAGTGNLLAKMLGLNPEKIEDRVPFALETIRNGRVISIDLGTANGTPFALNLGIGPIAMAITAPDKQEKNSHGLLSYVRPLLMSMFERPYKFQISTRGHSFECVASAIFVTNPQELGIGQKADATTLRDGKLDLIILNPQNLDDYVDISLRFGSWFIGNTETESLPYRMLQVDEAEIKAIAEMPNASILTVLPEILTPKPLKEKLTTDSTIIGDEDQPTTMLDGDVFGQTPVVVSTLNRAVDIYVPLATVT